MKTKRIPALVMLLGGAVSCIVTYINHYDLKDTLVVVTLSLVVFLVLGVIIKIILDSFDIPGEDKVDDEGEVVEKQGELPEDSEDLEQDEAYDEEESIEQE